MRRVRSGLASAETSSGAAARAEIARALADRIRETRTAKELALVAEEVLPEVEKFLESPREKRMRRMRTGTILSCIGLGAAVGMSITAAAMDKDDLLFLAALGVVCFFIGIAFVINGIFLSVSTATEDNEERLGSLTADGTTDETGANELSSPAAGDIFPSVTEHTTRHLKEDKWIGVDRDG